MNKNVIDNNINEILNFIENELRNNKYPIFVEISQKIFDAYGLDVSPTRVAQLCKIVNKEKGLNIDFNAKQHSSSRQKREYIEACKEAEASGVTDEEIYLCRLRGYSFTDMNRIYFEMTGKLLSVEYFSEKYVRYCTENSLPKRKNSKSNPEAFKNISEEDLSNHSTFFKKMYHEKRTRSTRAQKKLATTKLIDPYKKLHEEMKNDNVFNKVPDDR